MQPRVSVAMKNKPAMVSKPAQIIRRVLHNEAAQYLMRYVENTISSQIQPDGRPFPKKQPKTIKAYQRKGWDTQHYLVATGDSTELKVDHTKATRVIVRFKGQTILGYHVPFNEGYPRATYDKGLYPMEFNDAAKQDLLNLFKVALVKGLK